MHRIFILSVFIFVMCSAHSQNDTFKTFLDSFDESDKNLISLRSEINTSEEMTSEQARQYVYHGDSSKLYCHEKIFNMETEEVSGISKEMYLPRKVVKVTSKTFTVFGYSFFECHDPNKLLKSYVMLKIVDNRDLQVTDSLLVYRGHEYDWEMTGLINPQNNKIFVAEQLGKREFNAQVFIYKINDALKFEVEKKQDGVTKMEDDLENWLESIGWKEAFLN